MATAEAHSGLELQQSAAAGSSSNSREEQRLPLFKRVKRFAKNRLFDLCEALNDLSAYIQEKILHCTLEQRRAESHLAMPLAQMDQDLLAMVIRWNGHQVEKTVRYKGTPGSTHGIRAATLLRSALDEWQHRSYPQRPFTMWAEENLEDYSVWQATGEPQMHSQHELPTFDRESPVWDVIRNRVSTRFWAPVPVEDEKIQAILEASTFAPTACNRQTWKLYVHKNTELELNTKVSGASNVNLRKKAPVTIYITIDQRLYPEIWAAAEDAGIIGLQLSLAATSLGLGGCLMYGAESFDQAAFQQEYAVPPYRFMYLMYMFGYPAERTLSMKRAHPDDVAIFV
jgi:nitroreductase